MIEQSIAKQYGILPSQQNDLSYEDWAKLVGGLMGDTPLGQIIDIRRETNREKIKEFTQEQKNIRSEWAAFKAKKTLESQTQEEYRASMKQLEKMFASMFAKGGGSNVG